jgi:hypothetical protein
MKSCFMFRVGQNRTCTAYMTVSMVVPLLKISYIHRTYVCMNVQQNMLKIPYIHRIYVCMYVQQNVRRRSNLVVLCAAMISGSTQGAISSTHG